ncbi:aspartate aminotransferase [Blattamonas nauphoetae]|uniref:Aspartate aminotransferase n=1 Tax=Blattamonas nauphoetae TaxID=2049346 RepID=A0ABQ9YME1_9EUKA|nr:aspartate aminotransferase [Blattamonas nauphoetae]
MEVAPVPAEKVLPESVLKSSTAPSLIRALFEEGNNLRKVHGDEVCDFSLGNPSLPPPKAFADACLTLAQDPPVDLHMYMPNIGRPKTRAVLARELSKWYNCPITEANLVLSCGAAAAINVLFHSIVAEGDEIIVNAPYFAEYLGYSRNVRANPVVVQCDNDFNLDVDAIEKAITDKTRAIIINSPNNPTGKIYSEELLIRLGKMLMKVYTERLSRNKEASPIFIVSDEPYRRISYIPGELPSIFNCYNYSFVVSSFAKDLSIPGERLGFIAISPALLSPPLITALSTYTRVLGFVNAPSYAQFALELALDAGCDISEGVKEYKSRRDVLHKGLIDAGLECDLPEGAFYLFPRVPAGMDDLRFAAILKEQLVLAVPGRAFGDSNCVRFAYCVDMKTIQTAIPKIKVGVEKAKQELAGK